jgi:exonuclease SbcD
MRVLHTSDWHLGRSFGPVSLRTPQEQFCDHLVEVVRAEGIELLVIAGDLYDRAIAPIDAIELFRDTVRRVRAAGAVIAAITGNHDGADRVSPYDDLLDASGVYLRGGYEGVGRVITHRFSDGQLDLVLLPFLEPQAAPDDFGTPPDMSPEVEGADAVLERRRRRTHEGVLTEAVRRARTHLVSSRSLAVAHAFVMGGEVSDSERQLQVGGTGAVGAEVFEGFSYTALGHLHRPQHIGRPTLRYSGTPMAYSFSEDHQKSLVLVDMTPQGGCSVQELPLDVGRGVVTLRGGIEELLNPVRYPDAVSRFVRAIVTDRQTVLDAKSRLERVYPHVVEIRLEPEGVTSSFAGPAERIEVISPFDATTAFWTEIEGLAPDAELLDVLRQGVVTATGVAS